MLKILNILFVIFGICCTAFAFILILVLELDHEIEILLAMCIAILSFKTVVFYFERRLV
jgi:hypothetical protein